MKFKRIQKSWSRNYPLPKHLPFVDVRVVLNTEGFYILRDFLYKFLLSGTKVPFNFMLDINYLIGIDSNNDKEKSPLSKLFSRNRWSIAEMFPTWTTIVVQKSRWT